jgi:ATP-dependent Clp protease ATP-binding subunit ClpA
VLVALAEAPSPVGDALRACGITAEAIAAAIGGESQVTSWDDGPIWLGRATQELVARAQGLALGAGDAHIGEEHLLVSILWSGSSIVESLLGRLAVAGEQIMAELRGRDVDLATHALPRRRSWGPWIKMPEAELEAATAELRRTGTLYRYKVGRDGPAISIAEGGD